MSVDAELGRASVDIDVLLGPLRQQLSNARGLVDDEMTKAGDSSGRSLGSRIASGIKSGLKTVAKAAAVTAAAGIVALGGLGFAGAKAGLQTASAMEQADVAFTTMLGSGKKADAFLGKLSAFAAKTPFEFPELQTAASSLVSVGVDANKVIPIMTTLGNATAGMGTGSDGIKRATVALQQMSAAGKITGEDLNQLRDAGVPVFDLLAAATGKSKEAVAELAQKGKLGKKELNELFKALESGKGLERFNGLMDKQSQTLEGQFSTLKDTVNMGLSNAVKPWLPTIKKGLGDISAAAAPFFDSLAKKSAQLAATAGPKLERVRAAVSDLLAGLTLKDAGDVGAPLEGLVAVGYRIRTVFLAVTGAVRGFIGGLQGKGPIDGFSGKMNTAALGLRALVLAFKDGDVTSDGFVGKMETVGAALKGIKDAVAGAFSSMKSGDASGAGASLGSMAESARLLSPLITQLAASVPSLNDVLSVSATVLKFAADHTDLLAKAMPLIIGGLIAFKLSQLAANVVQAASLPTKIAEVVVNRQLVASNRALIASRQGVTAAVAEGSVAENTSILTKARGVVATVAKTVAEKVAAGASKAMAAAQWVLNAALSANPIGLVIIALIALGVAVVIAWKKSETFRRIVTGAWEAIKAGVGAVARWFTTTVPAAFRQVYDAAKGKLDSLVSFVRGLPGRVTSALGDLGGLLIDKGADIVSGLINGIRGMGGRLAGFVKQFVKDHIPAPVAKALGISSPSKVMAEQSRWIPLGMVDGMLSKARQVRAAAMQLAAAATPRMTLAPAGVALAGGSVPGGGVASRLGSVRDESAPASGAGAVVHQKVYAQPGQSAQEIGTVAGNRVLFALGGGGR